MFILQKCLSTSTFNTNVSLMVGYCVKNELLKINPEHFNNMLKI